MARNDVPVNMRNLVAEACQIDLRRRDHASDGALYAVHRHHHLEPRGVVEIGHLSHVRMPDHAAKTRPLGLIGEDDAHCIVRPQDLAAVFTAKDTVHHFPLAKQPRFRYYTSTRSIPPSLARAT